MSYRLTECTEKTCQQMVRVNCVKLYEIASGPFLTSPPPPFKKKKLKVVLHDLSLTDDKMYQALAQMFTFSWFLPQFIR